MARFVFLILFLPLCVYSQRSAQQDKALAYLRERGEVYIRIDESANDLTQVGSNLTLDHKTEGNYRYAYVNRGQFNYLRNANISYEVLTPPSLERTVRMAIKKNDLVTWDSYPTYPQYVQLMQEFASTYPNICKLTSIGKSILGRDIWVLKISDNVMEDEPEPDFMYSSTMHGDETVGYVTLLRLTEYLLSNYNTDSRITNLINETEIWINPLANPDGTYASGDNTVNGATRNNAATLLTGMDGKPGVDLNRNFPDPRSGLHPDNYEWQPENIAMMNFLKAHTFAMSANFHSGEEVVNYPWDTWYKTHPDDAWYKYVSHLYADAVLAVAPLGYFNGFDRGISNGAMWYVINGGRQDYQNYYLHSREVTIEMSASKMPAASELPDFWNYHKEALLKYMEQVQYGIRGFVTDNETGNPLRAKLTVLGHDADSSQIYTDPLHGNFNRLIAQGVYDLKFSAPGYQDLVVLGVSVTNNVATNLNVKLDPAPLATNTLTDEIVDAFVAPNPITDESVLSYFLPTPQNVSLRIVGMNGYVLFSNTQFVDEGKHTFDFAFLGLDRGVYVCNVSIGAYAKQIKLLVVK